MRARASNETRYIVTDVVSIPVMRSTNKGEAYKVTKPGWGGIDWYSALNNYAAPVNRDLSDKTQILCSDEDTSIILYPKYGKEFVIGACEEVHLKDIPKQAEIEAMIVSDSCGYGFYAKDISDIKIFVTYDENGLIDEYRLDNWTGKPYDGETEISFNDLQSEDEYTNKNRAEIIGTLEHQRLNEVAA